jgi:hypothetical protein
MGGPVVQETDSFHDLRCTAGIASYHEALSWVCGSCLLVNALVP